MTVFVLEYRFDPDSERRLKVRPRHREYLEGLSERGHVVAAGPFSGDEGAMIVYAAADRAELDRLLAGDPYTVEGVGGERTIQEWQPFIHNL
jgi:uncharacterized protein